MSDKLKIDEILNIDLKVYSYLTNDNEVGTIITHPKLAPVFDNNKLFVMENVETKIIKLQDILTKGFISVGSVDIMDPIDIIYPLIDNNIKPCIKGKYMHGSRRRLIADQTEINFEYDPESDPEPDDPVICDFDDNNESSNKCVDLGWLLNKNNE